MNITERAAKVLAEIDAALARETAIPPGEFAKSPNPAINRWELFAGRIPVAEVKCEDAAEFFVSARTLLPVSLRMNKTVIRDNLDDLQAADEDGDTDSVRALERRLATLCDQWQTRP